MSHSQVRDSNGNILDSITFIEREPVENLDMEGPLIWHRQIFQSLISHFQARAFFGIRVIYFTLFFAFYFAFMTRIHGILHILFPEAILTKGLQTFGDQIFNKTNSEFNKNLQTDLQIKPSISNHIFNTLNSYFFNSPIFVHSIMFFIDFIATLSYMFYNLSMQFLLTMACAVLYTRARQNLGIVIFSIESFDANLLSKFIFFLIAFAFLKLFYSIYEDALAAQLSYVRHHV